MEAVCQEHGRSKSDIRLLLAFAHPKTGYGPTELDELFRLCREHNYVVGLAAIRQLLTISDKRKRRAFQTAMIREGWSIRRVTQELIQRFGRRKQGGRKPRIANDVGGILVQLERFAIGWQRWIQCLGDESDPSSGIGPGDLSPEVRAAMEDVSEAFEKLRRAIADRNAGE